jgi:hypothetical protein
MRSMQWQLGILGATSAFTYRHRETKKTLCRDGNVYTRNSVPVSYKINRIFRLLSFLHLALWYNYATWTKDMHTFQINTLIQFFNFWRFLHFLNCPPKEPLRFKTSRRHKKLNESINLKSVHFVGSCCIRIFWHYGQRKQTSPCLILMSLLFYDSCKGISKKKKKKKKESEREQAQAPSKYN